VNEDIFRQKKELRIFYKEKLKEFAGSPQKKEDEQSLCQNLLILLNNWPLKKVIGVYSPMLYELDIRKLLDLLVEKKYAFPRQVVSSDMDFACCSLEDLTEDWFSANGHKWALKSPPKNLPSCDPDIIIIPGLAFDRFGHRLGLGKGYYDNYCINNQNCSIGVAFSWQVVADPLPLRNEDMVLDFIVTEQEVIDCRQYKKKRS
jgi:5-formyltetrahydrofolate cyclo-ligase